MKHVLFYLPDNLAFTTAHIIETRQTCTIKENIEKEAVYRINFCKDITKLAIPKLIKKLPEGVELDDERIENLASVFPLQYLSMFEQMKKGN